MKVLWITNILFPEAAAVLTGNKELKSSGGWMLGAANQLVSRDDVNLCVASVSSQVGDLKRIDGNKITYYILPSKKRDYANNWIAVNEEFCPDVVHIYGTESSHGRAYIKACGFSNVVISIQGLLSACDYYYCYGLNILDIYKNITLRDLLKGTILKQQKYFRRCAKYELDMIESVPYIIGRTSWDRAKIWAINPKAKYYCCNEILRPEFYDGSCWSYDKCFPYSIFISQANYPIKGFHQLLKAMPLILRHFPHTTIRVAGFNPTECSSLYQRLKLSGYGRYLKRLISKHDLENHIIFLGPLTAEQMKSEYLRSNVFISPSSIENSPNSLGEAQILGVPCISSYVGGAMDMMSNNFENLYRFEDVEMLAFKVCKIFENKGLQVDMSDCAHRRHNMLYNDERLYGIYKEIISAR